ncbi:MAG: replication-associated recombination protein A [Desulfovibrio sp.]|jgi:putative ATPase|nr:replication-associated recombination protein A [Desulfovibrio sp.]
MSGKTPLAERLRPENLDFFVGQEHLRDKLENLLRAKRLPSLLFYGPPGSGKSSLALLLASGTRRSYKRVSAPEAGIQQLRRMLSGTDLLILDEVHRFSKAQQDFFLPLLESGELTLFATTTENPSFCVTAQLLSRLHVLRLHPLPVRELLRLAERGAHEAGAEFGGQSLEMLVNVCGGDARMLLNLVEYAADLPADKRTEEGIKKALPEIVARHDRLGDKHYDLASALIKSLRGSDPDAAVYYLACLLEGGEDPRFVCRRLILSAAEDVGLADPRALPLAVACLHAVEAIGMPEGYLPMAETAIYLALSPKSNSAYAAYLGAQRAVRGGGAHPVPLHLRNPCAGLQRAWGYGKDYLYPHNYPESWVEQEYLPEGLHERQFYFPKGAGDEGAHYAWRKRILERLKKKPEGKDQGGRQ